MLAICKKVNEALSNLQTTSYEVGKLYRYLDVTEGDTTQYLVWGVSMDKETFDECFTVYAPIVIDRVKQLGIYDAKKDKLVNKTAFIRDYADAHLYGKRGSGTYVIYVGHPRKNMFGIQAPSHSTKSQAFLFAYQVMQELLNGDVTHIDTGHVKWYNTGIPVVLNTSRDFYDNTIK